MIFEHPFYALLATTLGVLLLFYWLHQKVKPCVIPALFLWLDEKSNRLPGSNIHPHRLPLTFYLESIILLLLIAAAVSPLLQRGSGNTVQTVILDNSYSMQAKDSSGQSSREKVLALLEPVIADIKAHPIRLLLAGKTVRNLGEFTDPTEFQAALEQFFHCTESTAVLTEAVAMARKTDPINLQLSIYSDHLPPAASELPANTTCHAVGSPGKNIAIVRALRTRAADQDKILLLLQGNAEKNIPYQITEQETGRVLASGTVSMANGNARLPITIPAGSKTLTVTVGDGDVLSFDDTVTLQEEKEPAVRYRLDLTDSVTVEAVSNALEATKNAIPAPAGSCDLLITDKADTSNPDAAVILRIFNITGRNNTAAAMQFAINRTNALTEGMTLDGVIWAGIPETPLPGEALVRTGKKVPLSCYMNTAEQLEIVLTIDLKHSTLTRVPAWPIFFANVVEVTSARLFANNRHNFSDDETIRLAFPLATDAVVVTNPDTTTQELKLENSLLELMNLLPGNYKIQLPDGRTHEFQVQSVNLSESDLSTAETRTFYTPKKVSEELDRFFPLAPFLILTALLLGAFHQFLIRRKYNAIR